MSRAVAHPLIGQWRIVEADLWDSDYLDLVEPASMTFGKNGRGEFAFGAVHGDMELRYAPGSVHFTWAGFDEMDDVNGVGFAKLDDDGNPPNRAILPPWRRCHSQGPSPVTSSTAC